MKRPASIALLALMILPIIVPIAGTTVGQAAVLDTSVYAVLEDQPEYLGDADLHRAYIKYTRSGVLVNVTYADDIPVYSYMQALTISFHRFTMMFIDVDNNMSTGGCVEAGVCGYDMVVTLYNIGDGSSYVFVEYFDDDGNRIGGELVNAWIVKATSYYFAVNIPGNVLFNSSDTVRILKLVGGVRVHDTLDGALVTFTPPYASINVDGLPGDWPNTSLVITDAEDGYYSPSLDALYMAVDDGYIYFRFDLNAVLEPEVVDRLILLLNTKISLDVNGDTRPEFSLYLSPACITVEDLTINTQNTYCGLRDYTLYYNGTRHLEAQVPLWLVNGSVANGTQIGVALDYFRVEIQDNLYNVNPGNVYVAGSLVKFLYSTIVINRITGLYTASPIYKKVIIASPTSAVHPLEQGIGVIEANATRPTTIQFTLYDRDPLASGLPYLENYVFRLAVSGDPDAVKWPIIVKLNLKPGLRDNVVNGHYINLTGVPVSMAGVYANPVKGYIKVYIDQEDYASSRGKIFYLSARKLFNEAPPQPALSISGFMHRNKIYIPIVISYPDIDYSFPSFTARVLESRSYTIGLDKVDRGTYIVTITLYDFDPARSVYYTVLLNIEMVDIKNRLEFTWRETLTLSAFDPIILLNLERINSILGDVQAKVTVINGTVAILNSRTALINSKVTNIQAKLVEMNASIANKLAAIDRTLAGLEAANADILERVNNVQALLLDLNSTTMLLYTTLGAVVANLSDLTIRVAEMTRNITILDTNMGRILALTGDALRLIEELTILLGQVNATSLRLLENTVEINTTLGLIKVESRDMLNRLATLIGGLEALIARTNELGSQITVLQDTSRRLEQLSTSIAGGVTQINTTIINYNNATSKKLDQILASSQDSARFSSLANIRIEEFKRISIALFAAVLASLVVIFSLAWHVASRSP